MDKLTKLQKNKYVKVTLKTQFKKEVSYYNIKSVTVKDEEITLEVLEAAYASVWNNGIESNVNLNYTFYDRVYEDINTLDVLDITVINKDDFDFAKDSIVHILGSSVDDLNKFVLK